MASLIPERKPLTADEKEQLKRLEAESDRLLDLLFLDPYNQPLLDQLNQVDVAIVRLSGETSMEY